MGRKIWAQLLKSCEEDFYTGIGEAVNCAMTSVFHDMSTKNVSVILIVFESLQKVFDSNELMTLPYITDVSFLKEDTK